MAVKTYVSGGTIKTPGGMFAHANANVSIGAGVVNFSGAKIRPVLGRPPYFRTPVDRVGGIVGPDVASRTMMHLADAAFKVADNRARLSALDKFYNAQEKVRTLLYDPEKGYMRLSGKEAVDSWREVQTSIAAIYDSTLESMSPLEQQHAFAQIMAAKNHALNLGGAHAQAQMGVYEKEIEARKVKNALADISNMVMQPPREVIRHIDEYAAAIFPDDEVKQQQFKDSAMKTIATKALLSGGATGIGVVSNLIHEWLSEPNRMLQTAQALHSMMLRKIREDNAEESRRYMLEQRMRQDAKREGQKFAANLMVKYANSHEISEADYQKVEELFKQGIIGAGTYNVIYKLKNGRNFYDSDSAGEEEQDLHVAVTNILKDIYDGKYSTIEDLTNAIHVYGAEKYAPTLISNFNNWAHDMVRTYHSDIIAYTSSMVVEPSKFTDPTGEYARRMNELVVSTVRQVDAAFRKDPNADISKFYRSFLSNYVSILLGSYVGLKGIDNEQKMRGVFSRVPSITVAGRVYRPGEDGLKTLDDIAHLRTIINLKEQQGEISHQTAEIERGKLFITAAVMKYFSAGAKSEGTPKPLVIENPQVNTPGEQAGRKVIAGLRVNDDIKRYAMEIYDKLAQNKDSKYYDTALALLNDTVDIDSNLVLGRVAEAIRQMKLRHPIKAATILADITGFTPYKVMAANSALILRILQEALDSNIKQYQESLQKTNENANNKVEVQGEESSNDQQSGQ